MRDDLISVLLPVHNGLRHLPSALRSVLGQTHRNLEVLVIDDGSTDGSGEWVSRVGDPRIRLIRHREPLGVARALNAGLAAASGPWVARMDADDISLPRRFAKQVKYLREHPEVVAVGTRIRYFGGPLGMIDVRPDTASVCTASLVFGTPLVHPSVMMRRAALTSGNLQYRAEFSRSEDYDLWVRLAETGQLANLPEVLLRYRLHGQSVSAKHGGDMAAQQRSIIATVLERRGLELREAEIDLLHRVVRCERSRDAAEIRRAGELLMRLVALDRVAPAALHDAAAIVWLRYCANNGHCGLASWRMFREPDLRTGVPGAALQEVVFRAVCAWHQVRGSRHRR